ncbi:hypothetical protein BVRB_6g149740 [Beta vulgaris subsp. vulgaris]|nr:hypothetical protein BVRB_6g149740 [Beta vulgaris subsp. vulgaris]
MHICVVVACFFRPAIDNIGNWFQSSCDVVVLRSLSARGGAVSGAGRGRGTLKSQPKKILPLPQNGIGRKGLTDIQLLHTDTLIKEVEKVFSANHPDPAEVEKAKKVLKEHEQALLVGFRMHLMVKVMGESIPFHKDNPWTESKDGGNDSMMRWVAKVGEWKV